MHLFSIFASMNLLLLLCQNTCFSLLYGLNRATVRPGVLPIRCVWRGRLYCHLGYLLSPDLGRQLPKLVKVHTFEPCPQRSVRVLSSVLYHSSEFQVRVDRELSQTMMKQATATTWSVAFLPIQTVSTVLLWFTSPQLHQLRNIHPL